MYVCVAYMLHMYSVVKEVAPFHGLSQLIGVAHKRKLINTNNGGNKETLQKFNDAKNL